MPLLKSILNFVKPPPDSVEPVREFILDLEPDATPVPMGSIEEAKAFVLSLAPGIFNFETPGKTDLPSALPSHIKEFFGSYSRVWSDVGLLQITPEWIEYWPQEEVWLVDIHTFMEYQIFCFPRDDSKLYLVYCGVAIPQCNLVFDSMWHYLWHYYLEYTVSR